MDERLIYERLKALSGGVEREQYRDISKAFMEVVSYNKKALEELKSQINLQLSDSLERYYLYGAVTKAGDAPIVNDFLFPMAELKGNGSIATVFCQCPPEEMESIFSEPQSLLIKTPEGEREISARLLPCQRYLDRISRLKQIYYENGICWRTPFLPYVYRFGDVFSDSVSPEEEILSLRFKDRDVLIRHDLIPLWNVEPIKLKCTVFPVPAIDEQNFKHTLRLPFAQDGYVVSLEEDIKNISFSQGNMVVIAEEKKQKEFHLYRIAVKRNINVPHYPLTTNYRPMRHIDRQADHSFEVLKTRGEIARIVSSYEVSADLELAAIEEGGTGTVKATEERYEFRPRDRESILLQFVVKKNSFLIRDTAAFLVTEVQNTFPYLTVTGELQW